LFSNFTQSFKKIRILHFNFTAKFTPSGIKNQKLRIKNSPKMPSQIPIPAGLTESFKSPQAETLEMPNKNSKLYIGIPRENSFQENRIALVPNAIRTLTSRGHRIIIQSESGLRAGFTDQELSEAGAEIVHDKEQVFKANILLKVAPPSLEEIELCQPNQVLISPIHLPTLTPDYIFRLKNKRVIAMAMEYIKDEAGAYPFVRMMSEMAGISAIQTAAELLSYKGNFGMGSGMLLGGISGIPPAKVVILGSGVVAEFAARAAIGMGAEVRVFDNNVRKLMRLQHHIGQRLFTSTIDMEVLKNELSTADVAIGAIHSEAGRTKMVVSEDMVQGMKSGSVIIDVSIDQGGCFATSRVTTHDKPTFVEHDVIHYCVPNIASRVPHTGSMAFSNILTPMLLLASGTKGLEQMILTSRGLQHGVYVYKSCLTNHYLSERFNMKFTELQLILTTSL
jgi:alanine dehydrogenase